MGVGIGMLIGVQCMLYVVCAMWDVECGMLDSGDCIIYMYGVVVCGMCGCCTCLMVCCMRNCCMLYIVFGMFVCCRWCVACSMSNVGFCSVDAGRRILSEVP